jgi:hypothetical protein
LSGLNRKADAFTTTVYEVPSMKDSRVPTFSSPELQKVVTDVRPILEGADEARNRVSNNIKALEAYLDSFDLKTSFRHPLGMMLIPDDEQNTRAALEYSGSASGTIQEEALVWGPDSKGKLRLLYEVSLWDGSIEVDVRGGPYFWDEKTLRREAKPLIETKLEIRKRLYQYLPAFVANLAEHLDVGQRLRLDNDVAF